VGGTIYNTHTLKPFKELGLDSQRVKKLASKLHVHSVNFAAKFVHTRRAFPVLLSTLSRSRFQAKPATLLIPIDFSFPFRGGGALRYSIPKWLLFVNNMGSGFHCLRSVFFILQHAQHGARTCLHRLSGHLAHTLPHEFDPQECVCVVCFGWFHS